LKDEGKVNKKLRPKNEIEKSQPCIVSRNYIHENAMRKTFLAFQPLGKYQKRAAIALVGVKVIVYLEKDKCPFIVS